MYLVLIQLKLLYILSVDAYNELLQEGEFDDVQLVGNDAAAKLGGTIGNFYGSPVVVSDQVGTAGDGLVANTQAFVYSTYARCSNRN